MMRRIILTLLLQCAVSWAFAQFTLKGTVKNTTGIRLPGANLAISGGFGGAVTNAAGEYRLDNLKPGMLRLTVSFVGYKKQAIEFKLSGNQTLDFVLEYDHIMAEEVLVSATRAGEKSPVAFATVAKDVIKDNNMGQDIPYLLGLTPSFVATSDAGAGIGYTNFRIRGTDLNRINVTVNGVPMNNPESHGTWWVDVPDLASSTDNIQVQRGVGTSTNGAAAFGATINLQTTTVNREPYAEYNSSGGSFGSLKNSVGVGTGLINGKFAFDARMSKVESDGFIDRASSDLKSFFLSGGYFTETTILKINVFSGLQDTYQAWNGVPSVRLNNDIEGMMRYADHGHYSQKQLDEMLASNSRTYNIYTYKNEIDHYQQDHHQLLFSRKLSDAFSLNTSVFYIAGKGYYEQFKANRKLADYLITPPVVGGETIKKSDLVRRKWLDNDFYGTTFSISYDKESNKFVLGGGYNVYDGAHYGRVMWARYAGNSNIDHEWYRGSGLKKDFNLFAKYNFQLTENLSLFADLQYRKIDYTIKGTDDDLRKLDQSHQFDFFNPKVGIFYQINEQQHAFANFARANREPNRSNYVDADPKGKQPTHETLNDFELGYQYSSQRVVFGANAYLMSYNDQLVLTGEINDVGGPIMVNVESSYRAGIELMAGAKLSDKLKFDLNLTLSQNKIKDFTEYVDDWDNGGQVSNYLGTTDLSFSPATVANSKLSWMAAKGLELGLQSYFVGKQYIDNSSSDERKLDGYFLNNLKINYILPQKLVKNISLHLLVNNLFDTKYENNAWVYPYIYKGKRYAIDGFFPQAGIHFIAGIEIRL